jgi:hypothetical protein
MLDAVYDSIAETAMRKTQLSVLTTALGWARLLASCAP